MAFANIFSSSSAKPRDLEDIGSSGASTPHAGISTPQPDLTDRRLPGILSSYFGQVRSQSHHSAADPTVASSSSPRHKHDQDPPSPAATPKEEDARQPAAAIDRSLHQSIAKMDLRDEPQNDYPTPPMSSTSSLHKSPTRESVSNAASAEVPSSSRQRSPRRPSAIDGLPSKMRRSTLSAAAPLANVTTTSNVEASHFSTPDVSSPISSLSPALSPRVTAHVSNSADVTPPSEQETLTSSSRPQNTPPQTPRKLSTERGASRGASPAASSKRLDAVSSRRTSNSHSRAVIGEARGKLSVTIVQARGLRPSVDPYVVCQFQWNEYISKGPRTDSLDPDDGTSSPSGGVPIRRSESDSGRPMAIPMRSRQSSHTSMSSRESGRNGKETTEPVWNHEAVFDVVGEHTEIDVSVYDNSPNESFLGHIRFCPNMVDDGNSTDNWLKLNPRDPSENNTVSGEVRLRIRFMKVEKKHYGPEDFQILKLIGKGTFGQVFQVRKRDTGRVYAMKVLSKRVIVQKKEVAHTLGERNILVRTAMTESPFIVGLKFSFQTPSDLYLVTDYMSGGELFWHLQKEGRFNETRAKFYIAELILALQHLHQHDIVYRDLKPENILLDANGHIALCDFGLSKANLAKDDTTNTFCGTTEYLAPEVLLDEQGYTKMVDFWSLGVLVFEMCCGWSPFYAEDTQQMYKNIAFGKVRFPRDALSAEGRNFVKGLLNRNPKHRLGALNDAEELKAHPFFADIDWIALAKKNLVPPFKPKLKSELDTSNFDPEFTNALNGAGSLNARAQALASGIDNATTPLSPTMQANFKGFTFVDESAVAKAAARSLREESHLRRNAEDYDDDDVMEEDQDDSQNAKRRPGNGQASAGKQESDDEMQDEDMNGLTRTVTGGHSGPEDPMFNGDGFD